MDVCLGNLYLLGEINLVCWEAPHPAQATGAVQCPQVASGVAVVSVELLSGETELVLVSSQDNREQELSWKSSPKFFPRNSAEAPLLIWLWSAHLPP